MKKKLSIVILLAFIGFFNINAQTVTSAANGNWTNPLTWGGTVPIPGNTIIINHNITLDLDFGYTSGSITINSGASLTGNSGMRGLALNYPSGSGSLTVSGTLDIARVSIFTGNISVSGSFLSDSLYNLAHININGSGSIDATQFYNGTGGKISNDGEINSSNLLNLDTLTNNGVINSSDFHNCKSLLNNSSGVIALNHDFLNSDSIAGPAIFTNNGRQEVMNDWQNKNQVDGTGKFCIVNNTSNSGTMTGSFDFCDLSGGNIDLNTGSVDLTITFCNFPCTPGTHDEPYKPIITISPNPANGVFTIRSETKITRVEIINLLGETVYIQEPYSDFIKVDLQNKKPGIYFYRILKENNILQTGKIIVEK